MSKNGILAINTLTQDQPNTDQGPRNTPLQILTLHTTSASGTPALFSYIGPTIGPGYTLTEVEFGNTTTLQEFIEGTLLLQQAPDVH